VAEGSGERGTAGAQAATDVFLSYASQDAAVAQAACEALEQAGVTCWIAPRDVTPGKFYADEIVHAIDDSKTLVLILSESAAASPHVLREVERAASKRHPVVSLRIDKAPLPAGLEYFLNTSQWLDASDVEPTRTFPRLIAAARASLQASSARPPTGPPSSSATKSVPARSMNRTVVVAVALIGIGIAAFAADRLWVSRRAAAPMPLPSALSSTTAPAEAAASIPEKSLAVLPFVDMSEKQDQEYFSDGMSEELIDMLTRISDLRVPARTSSFYFKGKSTTIADIAKTLGVAYVLEGSVRKSGQILRVTAQLIRADSGYHIWSASYDRALDDVFKVQDEIASAVVTSLKVTLANQSPGAALARTSNTAAYEQYLIGRQFLARTGIDNYRLAEQAFRKALTFDSSFAAAYAGLAQALYLFEDDQGNLTPADYQQVVTLLDRAIELAPNLSDSYSERGVEELEHGNLQAARADLSLALELDPNSGANQRRFGFLQRCLGNLDAAIVYGRKATNIDPLDVFAWTHLGEAYAASHRDAEAADAQFKAVQINPESPLAIGALFDVKLRQGRADEVLGSVEQLHEPMLNLYYRAKAEFTLGNDSESRKALENYIALVDKKNHPAWAQKSIADIYAWRGEKEKALDWLERAASQGDAGIACINSEPEYAEFHNEPRFKELVRRLKLAG
jgi:adenylate cyclase